ncbi:DNA replication and repair protein RecF [Ruficoccus amylovorans]|uniref:DNA replication and repair protein RecF n=1 Tax=Ruficoccus amylovorans TaxID=1804625 RepID=A0A842HCE7_9BACT|nr:DNA replication/repair protein RecF [Ruficoccus amylovorans]MBC2594092.1 DNA replication and repair protein RecF [Ruficoccus amylovorans]
MKLLRLNAENFRNIELASLRFEKASTFLLGRNGQGKTNLLEAAGMVTALRSFRTSEARSLIRHGQRQARLFLECEREGEGAAEITLSFASAGKQITCDGENVTRLADFIGRFPTVTLSSEDIQLIRGGPALRRRFLDLTLSAMRPDYFEALRRYHRALKERNSLLKSGQGPRAEAELSAFDKALAPAAVTVCHLRREGVEVLTKHLCAAYAIISEGAEEPELRYRPESGMDSPETALKTLRESRAADFALKSTQRGPHRDDLGLYVAGKRARDYASEGQQRSYVVSLRLAQMTCFEESSGVAPVILADDVLGELDPVRRQRFWGAVGADRQIIATGTEPPPPGEREWDILRVDAGTFSRESEMAPDAVQDETAAASPTRAEQAPARQEAPASQPPSTPGADGPEAEARPDR